MFDVAPAAVTAAGRWAEMRSRLWPDEDAEDLLRGAEAYFSGGVAHLVEVLLARDPEGAVVGFAELSIRPYAEGCVSSRVAFLEGWYVEADSLVDNPLRTKAHLALGFAEVEAPAVRAAARMLLTAAVLLAWRARSRSPTSPSWTSRAALPRVFPLDIANAS
jgi:hypothetical protein